MQKVAEERYTKFVEIMLRSTDKKEVEIEELVKAIPTVMKITEIKAENNSLQIQDADTK